MARIDCAENVFPLEFAPLHQDCADSGVRPPILGPIGGAHDAAVVSSTIRPEP
jgi:hypothetical protein